MLSKPEFLHNKDAECDRVFQTVPGYQKLGKEGVDLLRQLLRYEPSERISSADALNHPYFQIAF
jgi:cyclin-dependent kinase